MVHASRGRSRRRRRTCAARSRSSAAGAAAARRPLPCRGRRWRDYDAVRDADRADDPGFEDYNERVAARAASSCRTRRATRAASRPTPARRTSRSTADAGGAGRPPAAADDPLARPVQHHDLRARRPLPRDQAYPTARRAGRVRAPRRPRRDAGRSPTATAPDCGRLEQDLRRYACELLHEAVDRVGDDVCVTLRQVHGSAAEHVLTRHEDALGDLLLVRNRRRLRTRRCVRSRVGTLLRVRVSGGAPAAAEPA
jgi:hypothetical protein